MPDSEFDNRLGALIDDFVRRKRRGEDPDLQQFALAHPDLADELLEIVPTLLLMEGAAPVAEAGADDQLPQLADYRIIGEIGRGGMGVVYKAEQISLRRTVALKTLPAPFQIDSNRVERFLLEARAAAALQHPNIVPVYDVGMENGVCFYTMRLIDAVGLDQVLENLRQQAAQRTQSSAKTAPDKTRQSKVDDLTSRFLHLGGSHANTALPGKSNAESANQRIGTGDDQRHFRQVACIGERIADALNHLHINGVLHRDIKPSNLLLDRQGKVWLTDFGLAKFDRDDLTQTGSIVGTLRYISPERFNGWSDHRSDLYSLGITLYELLALKQPFATEDRSELIRRILHEDPVRLRRLCPSLPHGLETIVHKAIAKEPSQRYRNAADLRDDLRRFVENKPIAARRTQTWERLRLWSKRNPRIALLSAAILAVTLFTIVSLTVSTVALLNSLDRTRVAETNERQMRVDSNRRLYDAYLASAAATRATPNRGRRLDSVQAIIKAIEISRSLERIEQDRFRLRNEMVASLATPDVGQPQVPNWISGDSEDIVWSIFNHSATRILTLLKSGAVEIRDAQSGRRLARIADKRLLELDGATREIQFSPNDEYIGVRWIRDNRGGLQIWRLSDQSLLKAYPASRRSECCGFAFSPNNNEVAFVIDSENDQQKALLLNFRSATQTMQTFQQQPPVDVAKRNGEYVLPLRFLKKQVNTEFQSKSGLFRVQQICFCPDGDHLLFVEWGQAHLYHRFTRQWLGSLGGPNFEGVTSAAWSHDGRFIALGFDDAVVRIWEISNSRAPWATLQGHLDEVERVGFSPDSSMLVSTSQDLTTRVWDVFSGRELIKCEYGGHAFSSDQKSVLFRFSPTRVARAKLHAQREVRQLFGNPELNTFNRLAFSPEGRYLTGASRYKAVRTWDTSNWETRYCSLTRPAKRAGRFNDRLERPFQGFTPNWDKPQPDEGDIIAIDPAFMVGRAVLDDGNLHPLFCSCGYRDGESTRQFVTSEPPPPDWLPADQTSYFDQVDGGLLATSVSGEFKTVLWKLTPGGPRQPVAEWTHPQSTVALPRFSHDGRLLALSLAGETRIYALPENQLLEVLPSDRDAFGRVAFSPDGELICVLETSQAKLLRSTDFQPLVVLTGPQAEQFNSKNPVAAADARFAPDSRRLAIGTLQNTILVWDLRQINDQLTAVGLGW